MINCQEATEFVSLSCEQKLSFKRQLQLKIHLWICPKCRHFKENNDKLREMMKEYRDK